MSKARVNELVTLLALIGIVDECSCITNLFVCFMAQTWTGDTL